MFKSIPLDFFYSSRTRSNHFQGASQTLRCCDLRPVRRTLLDGAEVRPNQWDDASCSLC